jgi:hypothetical protein
MLITLTSPLADYQGSAFVPSLKAGVSTPPP